MSTQANIDTVKRFKVGTMDVEVYPSRESMGEAAARATAEVMKQLALSQEVMGVIFATGASQLATLDALTKINDLPWSKVCGFHLDEYVALPIEHPASFRGYLRRNLTSKVPIGKFNEVDGTAADLDEVCRSYAEQLRAANPQLCLLGIGENGHLAFNDPPVADFKDPLDVKVVKLDEACRIQQTAEGWFKTTNDVPEHAVTLTIPSMLRVPKLIVSVPGIRKAAIMRRALTEEISTACPATILRTHPGVTIYLDKDSASELSDFLPSH